MGKILFIGAGNMGQSIIAGIISKNIYQSGDIYIYEVDDNVRNNCITKYKVNEQKAIDIEIYTYEYVILAVKPQIFQSFFKDNKMKELSHFVNEKQSIVSIMAGITISRLKEFFGQKSKIIRVMPNFPCLIGEAVSVLSSCPNVTKPELESVKKIFDAVGITEILDEKYLDAVTGLSGSGPAYIFMFIESLTQGGVLCGLSKTTAEKLAIQTVLGSVKMCGIDRSIEDLRHAVTSPGGTTIEALSVLENKGFRSSVIEAVRAAANKSRELGK